MPLRLFCFPHAGGGPTTYRHWHRALGPHVSVRPVHLPRCAGGAGFTDVDSLVAALDSELGEQLTAPHVFFGHSMGALVAYRLACRRRASGHPLPRALLLSGYAAPHLPAPLPPVDGLDDAALIAVLRAAGGVPAGLPDLPDFLDRYLPALRDDLRLCTAFCDPGDPPLSCPAHVFGGDADPLVGERELHAWDRHTTRLSGVRMLAGNHFYLDHAPEQLFRVLRPLLRRYAAAG
ncbi:thioesterase II family protein [Rhodococcus koreensis]|uniref:thioesterase II family protein n=1 Tax=Rhodococcus koreensis TaxID=99653 RepID=UPI00366D49E9